MHLQSICKLVTAGKQSCSHQQVAVCRVSSVTLKLVPSLANRGRSLERPPDSLIKAQVQADQLWLWLQWAEADLNPWTVKVHQVHLSKFWEDKEQCGWLKQKRGVLLEALGTVKQCLGDLAKVPSDLKHKMPWLQSTRSKHPAAPKLMEEKAHPKAMSEALGEVKMTLRSFGTD